MRTRKLLNSIPKKELVVYLVIGFYFGGLVWLTFLNRNFSYTMRIVHPFWSYGQIVTGHFDSLKENIENVILFVPLGYFYKMLFHQSHKKALYLGLLISIMIELMQFFTTLGIFEFDDILHNSVGALLGSILYHFMPVRVNTYRTFIKKICAFAFVFTVIGFIGYEKVASFAQYQKMIPFAALNDIDGYKNLLVPNGVDGYAWDTEVYVEYNNDGSISIKGTSDKRSWYQLSEMKLSSGTYVFTGLSGVEKNTIGLELEYYNRNKHTFERLIQDVGPEDEVVFTIEKKTKIRAYVSVYEGTNCNVTARPALYKKE